MLPDDLALLRHVLTSDTADPTGVADDDARGELAWLTGDTDPRSAA